MQLIELGQTPISKDKSTGEDVRYSQDFGALQEEIDLLAEAKADGRTTDWAKVEKISQDILANKSKDINVAVYLAVALQQTHGLQGLADGAKLLQGLTSNFWDKMYPPKKRKRGRLNAYTWWKEKTMAFLQDNLPQDPQDSQLVQGMQDTVQGLDQVLGEKAEDAPILRDILKQIERIPVVEPESEPEPEPETKSDSQSEQNKSQVDAPTKASRQGLASKSPEKRPPTENIQAVSPPSDVASLKDQDAAKLFKQSLDSLASYRDWLISKGLNNPLIYRINRWFAWSQVQNLPPLDGSFTRLPPPEEQITRTLEQLLSQSKFEQALHKAESHVPEYLFWLDLSHASARALKGLGQQWQTALRAVETETVFYVKRLPGIENQAFSDGTPFCSEQTLSWIESLSKKDEQGRQEENIDAVQQAIQEAEKRAAANDLMGALKLLDQALRSNGLLRNRYRLHVGMLKLLTAKNNFALAASYTQKVIDMIENYNLLEWEPDLALEGLKNAYMALSNSQNVQIQNQAQEIIDKLISISPASALRLSGPSE